MRRSGQTTREVDAAIQELFSTGKTVVRDHYQTFDAVRHQFDVLLKRLASEHQNQKLVVDRERLAISLIKDQPSIVDLIRPYQELISYCQEQINRVIDRRRVPVYYSKMGMDFTNKNHPKLFL